MAYPLYSRLMEFRGESAQLLNGGELRFFELDTTTPKAVYADFGLTMTNGSTVDLDASSRMNEGAFGSGNYYVKLFDSANVQQGEDYLYEPGGAALSIPIPNPGEFLTGDGSQLLVEDLSTRLVPDATGHSADILGNDGDVPVWVAKPANGADGDDPLTDFRIQYGTGSASATGAKTATTSVTFAHAYATAPKVLIGVTGGAPGSAGVYPHDATTTVSTTGFTVTFSTLTGGTSADNYSGSNLTGATNFVWVAFGDQP